VTRDPERIADIVSATGRIADIVDEGRTAFEASHVLQAALLYNIQVIGEASATSSIYLGCPRRTSRRSSTSGFGVRVTKRSTR